MPPIPKIVKASNHAKSTTGTAAAKEKAKTKNGADVVKIKGINIPKYKTPLYGQNARDKISPKRKESHARNEE